MSAPPLWGETLSTVAALSWAVSVILFRRAGETAPPLPLNLFKNVVAVALLIPTLLAAGVPIFPHRPLADWALLAGSAFIGITLADTLFFMALNRLGAGLLAIVDTLYSPAVIGLSFLFLGERLGPQALVGAALVIGAIVIGGAGGPPRGAARREIIVGLALGALCMMLMALGIVMIKRLLDTTPVLWASLVRLFCGALGLAPLALTRRGRADLSRVFRPSRLWRTAIPASALGAYLAMIAWIGGMKCTLASVAAVLNQLSTIFIFVLAWALLKEPLNGRRTAAVGLALAGALLVALR